MAIKVFNLEQNIIPIDNEKIVKFFGKNLLNILLQAS